VVKEQKNGLALVALGALKQSLDAEARDYAFYHSAIRAWTTYGDEGESALKKGHNRPVRQLLHAFVTGYHSQFGKKEWSRVDVMVACELARRLELAGRKEAASLVRNH
jgi:hypothetical protein